MKRYNVLLINPGSQNTFWSFKWVIDFIGKKASMPPLGLLTIVAMMPQEWQIRFIDMNIEPLTDKDLSWAEIVMIGAMSVQRKSVNEILERCERFKCRVVVGGQLFSTECEKYQDCEKIDHLVLDEGEITFKDFLRDFENDKAKRVYRNETGKMADLTASPMPRYDLLKLSNYATLSVQFSRGCPHECEFCNVVSLFGRKYRIKTSKQIIEVLNYLYLLGWRGSVFFADDNFIGNPRFLKDDLLPKIIEWKKDKVGMTFLTQTTIKLSSDQDLMDLMAAAGFDSVFIGIETLNAESLAECSKRQNQNVDLLLEIQKIQKSGLQVRAGFMVGFDHDDETIFDRMIEFIQKSGVVVAMISTLHAVPGTRLWNRLKGEGRTHQRTAAITPKDQPILSPIWEVRNWLTDFMDWCRRYTRQNFFMNALERCLITFANRQKPSRILSCNTSWLRFGRYFGLAYLAKIGWNIGD